MKFEKTIAVDVDGTLIVRGEPNLALVNWCRAKKAEGYSIVLWSAAGREHAQQSAALCGATDIFETIIAKPGFIVDDNGWGWIRYSQVVRQFHTEGDGA